MARSIGKMSVTLAANATQFSATMKNAKADVKATADSVANAQGRIKAAIDDRDKFEERVQAKMASRLKSLEAQKVREAVQAEAAKRLTAGGLSESDATGKRAGKGYADGFISELNATFGKRSVMGKALKIAAGGGAIGALGMAANEFNTLAKGVESFSLAMAHGGDEWKSALGEMLSSIPILGKVGEGFYHLWQAVSGGALADEAAADAAKAVKEIADEWAKTREETLHAAKAADDYARQVREHVSLLGVREPERGLVTSRYEEADAIHKARNEEADKALDTTIEMRKQRQRLLDDLQKTATAMGVSDRTGRFRQALDTPLLGGTQYMYSRDYQGIAAFRAKYAWYAGQIEAIDRNLAAAQASIARTAATTIRATEQKGAADRLQMALDWGGQIVNATRDQWNKGIEQMKADALKRQTEIANTLQGARDAFTTEGMTERDRKLFDFGRMPGVSNSEVTAYRRELDALEAKKELLGDIAGLIERGQKWVEKHRATNAKEDAKQTAKAKEDFHEAKSPDLILGGSAQGQRFAYDFANGSQRMSKDDARQERQVLAAEQSRDILRDIRAQTNTEVVEIGN